MASHAKVDSGSGRRSMLHKVTVGVEEDVVDAVEDVDSVEDVADPVEDDVETVDDADAEGEAELIEELEAE